TPYLKHLRYLEKSQYFEEERIRDYQWKKIKKLLDHAYKNCEYYRDKFNQKGIHPNDIKSFDDYFSIPILKKEDVNTYNEKLIAPDMDKYATFLTSGSTGKPLKGYRNKDCQDFKMACGARSGRWAGYDFGERVYQLYGNPEKELKGLKKFRAKFRRKLLNRIEILDLLTMTEESMLEFAKKMQKKPPSLLWGHAHGFYTLARFYEKKGINDIRPKGIYSAGMVLHDWERKKVEDVFQCKFQDRYGCEELGLIASECKKQEGLHINTDALYVEFLGKDGRPVPAGKRGKVTITDLTNMVMPFIRYDMEDVGILSKEKCSCGITQPLIKKIEGRVADFLITPENELVSGISLTDHFAGHIPGVAQIQIVQDQINLLTFRIVKDEKFNNESQQQVSNLANEFFGNQMRYEYEFVDEILNEASGKYRFTICKVKHELL
ncbi:phenylacetate--CoA ligase family protein, partial [bacterium]|nr:phenylacetate--CoA ligase family protein [bacterium]